MNYHINAEGAAVKGPGYTITAVSHGDWEYSGPYDTDGRACLVTGGVDVRIETVAGKVRILGAFPVMYEQGGRFDFEQLCDAVLFDDEYNVTDAHGLPAGGAFEADIDKAVRLLLNTIEPDLKEALEDFMEEENE